ncbi:peptidase M10A and M12B matrixin and adamalysin [Streptococcus suis]|uniref:Peptidase M10A and M12B matrixin and adamalysin n=1 Tax=Streptococcus suis TaxID=1307 RepID=A0A0Z8PVH8_STRSU|nr:peptidase M10A and M12B matrixin and adamalysin [Streptococcus suis]
MIGRFVRVLHSKSDLINCAGVGRRTLSRLVEFFPTPTAEHELGHAIGLDHEDSQTSVMESAGSNHGIQQADIDAVLALYSE